MHFSAAHGESALPESTGPTGKRSARKRACSVWSGGKAAKPYLSLPIYTYSRSQGLFAGVSLEGTVIGTRNDANAAYYGRAVSAEDILSGQVAPPAGAERLRKVLAKY